MIEKQEALVIALKIHDDIESVELDTIPVYMVSETVWKTVQNAFLFRFVHDGTWIGCDMYIGVAKTDGGTFRFNIGE
jgi:hypothetical protein